MFKDRHIGPDSAEIKQMLSCLDLGSLDELCAKAIPANILSRKKLPPLEALSEEEALQKVKAKLALNKLPKTCYIGKGFYGTHVPSVISRVILQNPAWYTAYTPYQAEISQGRLELLFYFQTMICELTGMDLANASLLDEASAAAEAMLLSFREDKAKRKVYLVEQNTHDQVIEVLKRRAEPLDISIELFDQKNRDLFNSIKTEKIFGALFSYPGSNGEIYLESELIRLFQSKQILLSALCDPLALTLLKEPGALGFDIAFGSAQRFGTPMFFGGPHAAFFAVKDPLKRKVPGRLVGLSKNRRNEPAYRLTLQTREQHIRRDKATSNICTSQVLLAVINTAYAMYHGAKGLQSVAKKIQTLGNALISSLKNHDSIEVLSKDIFGTVALKINNKERFEHIAQKLTDSSTVCFLDHEKLELHFSFDETHTARDLQNLAATLQVNLDTKNTESKIPFEYQRQSSFMTHPVFKEHQSETTFMRYIRSLEEKDLSLVHAMIPLGSCTMKLNSASSLNPVTWSENAGAHPFLGEELVKGHLEIIRDLETWLSDLTGFDSVSMQPNSGAQGEYAGLLCIREYHLSRSDFKRNKCFVPFSAHGTNPASAKLAGMEVVGIKCLANGDTDLEDLKEKIAKYDQEVAALMITYPSTHGVFEKNIEEICALMQECGAQVYLDGANLNAQIGLCLPAQYGADVCHFNLHKTFSIPHGGGGPGVGPIAVKSHLSEFLPGHKLESKNFRTQKRIKGPLVSAPYGSAGIFCIPWMYIKMLGNEGLKAASQVAILNANYLAKKLSSHYKILYSNTNGFVAHECILDLRSFKKDRGVSVEDVAKRLVDYGFHAPTMAWPVPDTLMVEPTESENLRELDLFCEAMISIAEEIKKFDHSLAISSPLKNAPHSVEDLLDDEWRFSYSKKEAFYPVANLKNRKFWKASSRVDNAFGDRNLVCSCPPFVQD